MKIVRKRFVDESKAKKEANLLKAFKAQGDLEKRMIDSGGVWLTAQDVKKNIAKLKTKGKQTQAFRDQLPIPSVPSTVTSITTKQFLDSVLHWKYSIWTGEVDRKLGCCAWFVCDS